MGISDMNLTDYPQTVGKYGDSYPMRIILSVEPDRPDTLGRLDAIREFMADQYPQMPFHDELIDHFEMTLFKQFHALSYLCLSDEMFDSFDGNELFERRLIDEIDYY